jgi:hemoglobin
MRIRTVLLVVVLGVAACGGGGKKDTTSAQASTKPLYDRLGGVDGIKAVVKDFVEEQVAKDDRINARFANTDLVKLQEHLTSQICEATGGPCTYTGRNMKESHAGMGVTEAEWDALVEDLVKSLDKFDVGKQEQNELLAALSTMKSDIVEKP